MNATQKLLEAGQSIWYDNIQRSLLKNGDLAGMIQRGEIRGVTSNPTIFMNAITKSQDYDDSLGRNNDPSLSNEEVFFNLAIEDIQQAADLFLPLYDQINGGDGYVSLEVSPYLANDTTGTIDQAKKLWRRVNRPNLMIKIPATVEGIPAITSAITAGLNVNVTLIFSLERYDKVMDAYILGLEERVIAGLPIESIASVASFFISRLDTNVDTRLQNHANHSAEAQSLMGKAAIASARLAYHHYKRKFVSQRFHVLKTKGAQAQRPLWASTSTKNPDYRDVMYVEELIGSGTVNTIPPQTLAAFLDHGKVRPSLEEDIKGAQKIIEDLEKFGIIMGEVTRDLEEEGVQSFSDAFTTLLIAVDAKRKQAI